MKSRNAGIPCILFWKLFFYYSLTSLYFLNVVVTSSKRISTSKYDICNHFFEIFWEFFWRIILRNFSWEDFLGEIFWEDFYRRIYVRIFFDGIFLVKFFGEIFWVDFLGGNLWEEIFGRIFFGGEFNKKLFEYWRIRFVCQDFGICQDFGLRKGRKI